MAKLFIKDLKIGMTFEGEVFLLAESSLRETRAGSPYLKATLSDKTGRIDARYWDVPTAIIGDLKTGSGVRIDGVVEDYPLGSGQRQVRIEYLEPVEILDLEDYLPRTKRDLADMRKELRQFREGIGTAYLSRLLTTYSPTKSSLLPSVGHQPPRCTITPTSVAYWNTLSP